MNGSRHRTAAALVLLLALLLTTVSLRRTWASTEAEAVAAADLSLRFVGFEIDPRLAGAEADAAAEGLALLYGGQAFRNGIPESTAALLDRFVYERSPQEAFLQSGVLPSPPTRPASPGGRVLALGDSIAEREGSTLMTKNCFTCHAGASAGMAIAGLGNAHLDQAAAYSDYQNLARIEPVVMARANLLIALGAAPERDRVELENLFYQVNEMLIPTTQYARARGDNMGPFAVWTYLARLQAPSTAGLALLPGEETSAFTALLSAEALPTVDPNPWWHRKYKTSSYRYGEGSRHRSAHFALNFTNPHEEVNETHDDHVAVIDTILKFADQTRSPAYPGTLDAELEQAGAAYFHGEEPIASGRRLGCSGCHGSYHKQGEWGQVGGWAVSYQERGVQDVGTDTKYSDFLQRMQPLADRTLELRDFPAFQGQDELVPIAEVPAAQGYMAPPLVGAWVSAPYFHNGSVPTIEQVLDSSKRPTTWVRDLSPTAYDMDRLGLEHTTLEMSLESYKQRQQDVGRQSDESGRQLRAIYHTEDFGRSNQGHQHGDDMSAAEREAVIEFIKSLSGPNMVPVGGEDMS